MGVEGTFADLRRLADAFTHLDRPGLRVADLGRRLGATAVPLLLRELAQLEARRREVARDGLLAVATSGAAPARTRVLAALRELVAATASDDLKVCALGLLAELGERGDARFADTPAVQRRSALALAGQLHTPADVANAVDLMVAQLSGDDIVQMVELFVESTPAVAVRVAAELAVRVDLAEATRERVADAALPLGFVASAMTTAAPKRLPRPTIVAILVDSAGRLVVSACRKVTGERRWRRWAVLVGASGRIDDCLYDEDSADAAQLVASLCADGYRIASSHEHDARTAVATAARATVTEGTPLGGCYYRGRDLLELFDDHVQRARPGAAHRDPYATAIDRALQLLHAGDVERAETILLRIPAPPETLRTARPDLDAALAALAIVRGRHRDAIEPLARAIAAEPAFALHHWNLASAQHALGDLPACYHSLRRYLEAVVTSDRTEADRIALAQRLVAHIERSSRLAGTALPSERRASRSTRAKPKKP